MTGHPLRPANHRRLGRPLPYQQANGPRAHPSAVAYATFDYTIINNVVSCGISTPFGVLSPTKGQVTHVLLTRAPLYSPTEAGFLVRLACVRHAASVRPEPGSNSPVNFYRRETRYVIHIESPPNFGNYRGVSPSIGRLR